MIDYLILTVQVIIVIVLCILLALVNGMCRQKRTAVEEKKQDEAVEREMKRDIMDAGVEAIMAYSVRGNNGFEEDWGRGQ